MATWSFPVSAITTLPAIPAAVVVAFVGTISMPEGYIAACPGPPIVAAYAAVTVGSVAGDALAGSAEPTTAARMAPDIATPVRDPKLSLRANFLPWYMHPLEPSPAQSPLVKSPRNASYHSRAFAANASWQGATEALCDCCRAATSPPIPIGGGRLRSV